MDTAGAVVALSRLGATVKDRDAVVRALKGAQRPDGGFLGAEAVPNLPAAYRITRALMILKEKPDVEKLRGFIARCRNADGGYAHHPGEPSNPWTTYMAAIVHNWLDELEK